MSASNGNGFRFGIQETAFSETQLNDIADKVVSQVKPVLKEKDGIGGLKSFGILVGVVLALGGLVWTASKLTSEKANATDVTQLDKSLSQIMIKLEFIVSDLAEVKKDINDLEKILNNRK